eukprot:g21674.t1
MSTELSLCTNWKKKCEHVSFCSMVWPLGQKIILQTSEAKSEAFWLFISWRSSVTATSITCIIRQVTAGQREAVVREEHQLG